MNAGDAFDEWARDGKDRGMEERHWHTAKHALDRMPVEPGDAVLDLGCGSGYAGRSLREVADASPVYGIDASREMAHNASEYTDDPLVGFLVGDFEHLPFAENSIDHVFSMEAFFFASDPDHVLAELLRVLRPGGTFYCAVDRWEEHVHSHDWDEQLGVPMLLWSEREYRERFREAGFHVAAQNRIPDEETEIPPAEEFPTEMFATREAMVERHREFGTLLTVGVAP